ncbi:MAG: hypothetical protein ACPGJS_06420 [Flammeovirgaceae bacterium]
MITLPRKLKTTIPAQEILNVAHWWDKLNKEHQQELADLYTEDYPNPNQFVSIYLCGKFVEQEVDNTHDVFWINHFYEYLVNHELIVAEHPHYVGGTCSANKAAEHAIRKARIRHNFSCPNRDANCLMRQILNLEEGKKDFIFYVKFELENE